MLGLFSERKRARLRSQPFPSGWLWILQRSVPVFRRLSAEDQAELCGHIQVLLAEKHFEGCGGLVLTEEIKLTIAAQACLLLLHREGLHSDIDPYGATNTAEFFAVVTEMFFEKPRALKERHPELYAQLAAFYKQDPNPDATSS